MNVIRSAARLAPPGFVRWLGRLQFQVPMLRPLLRFAAAQVQQGESVIRHGVGAGLKFDPSGAHPGYALGTSEPQEQAVLANNLKLGFVFYDIGANVGFYTTLAARLVGPQGSVFGFEPFPQSAEAARKNAARNGFKHVTIIAAAVSKFEGFNEFAMDGALATTFKLSGEGQRTQTKGQTLQVPVVTIDAAIARGEIKPPNLLMIDVEGAELDVLEGMQETLRKYRPVILCEVHWISAADVMKKITDLVGPDAYQVTTLEDGPLPQTIEHYHILMKPAAAAK